MSDYEGVTAYPLSWPHGWKRAELRPSSRFAHTTFHKEFGLLYDELARLGVSDHTVVVSTNLKLRGDGIPYSGQKRPQDPGVAVYFELEGQRRVLACDAWDRLEHNLRAIVKHVEAMRGMERWGVGSREQAFAGFTGLPEHASGSPWWKTLGFLKADELTEAEIVGRYRELARERHPDREGGSHDAMAQLNQARDEGLRVIRGAA